MSGEHDHCRVCGDDMCDEKCYGALLSRLADLEAIVSKLPHTADGVPVVPGMRGYGAFRDGVTPGVIIGPAKSRRVMFVPDEYDTEDPHIVVAPDGYYMYAALTSLYSTREAAEQASKP